MSETGVPAAGAGGTTLGVISDTHDVLDPRVAMAFAGVERILHAGDICNPDVLWELEEIAPVTAVLGNMDSAIPGFALCPTARLRIDGVDLLLTHKLALREIASLSPSARAVVSGHTHVPSINIYGEVLYVNPGSASEPRQTDGRRTVGLLEIRRGRASARIVPL